MNLTLLFGVALFFAIVAYVPLVFVFIHRQRIVEQRRRPINEVLADALATGRISQESFEEMMDEVHRSMPSIDAPYPLVREFWEARP